MLQNIPILSSWETRSTEVIKGTDCFPYSKWLRKPWKTYNKDVNKYYEILNVISSFSYQPFLSLVAQTVKYGPAGDLGLISGSGRSPGGGNGNPLQYFLPGESPWTEEPDGLPSRGSPRVGHDWATSTFTFHCLFQQNSLKSVSILFGYNFSSPYSLKPSSTCFLPVPNLPRLTSRSRRAQAS